MAIRTNLPHHFKSNYVWILNAKKSMIFHVLFLLYSEQYNAWHSIFTNHAPIPYEIIQKAVLSVCNHHVLCHFMACALDNGKYNQFVSEQKGHGQTFEINAFWNEFLSQKAENWQSGFLPLAWRIEVYDIIRSCITAGPLRRPKERIC